MNADAPWLAFAGTIIAVPQALAGWQTFKSRREQVEAKRINELILNVMAGTKRPEEIRRAKPLMDTVEETRRQVQPPNGQTLAEIVATLDDNTAEVAHLAAAYAKLSVDFERHVNSHERRR